MLKIHANFNEGADVVEGMGKQLPFAVARTLTGLAQDGQAAGKEEIRSGIFKLRNDWTERNTKITPATKATLTAEVYTDTGNRQTGAPDYMGRQEDGGERVPVNGREHIAVPTKHLRQMAGGERKPIPDWLRPKALLAYAKKNGTYTVQRGGKLKGSIRNAPSLIREFFFFKVDFGGGKSAICARHAGDSKASFYPVYWLADAVKVKKRFHLDEDVQKAVEANLQKRWDAVLQETFPLKI